MFFLKKQIYILLGAKTFSDFGFAFDFICFTIFIWTQTGSPLATACLTATFYSGGVIGGSLTHRYGDRWNRRQAMIGADFFRMLMLLILVVLPAHAQQIWLYPTIFFIGAGRAIFESTLSASLPAMAGEKLQWVNSLASGLKSGALVIGMAFAAATIQKLGYRALFFIDAVTYGISALVLYRITIPFKESFTLKKSVAASKNNFASLFRSVGFSILLLLVVRALDALGSGTQHVGFPILGTALNKADPANVMGSLWAFWGIGMFLASFVLRPSLRSQMEQRPNILFLLATAIMSSGFIGIFWAPSWNLMLCSACIAGIGDGLSEIAFRQTLQKVDDSLRGGLFGFAEMMVNAGLITGILFTGWVATPSNISYWVLALHGIPIVAVLFSLTLLLNPGMRSDQRVKNET